MVNRKTSTIISPKPIATDVVSPSVLDKYNNPSGNAVFTELGLSQPNIPAHMLRKSSKKILNTNKVSESQVTKKLRMKSFLWVRPNRASTTDATSFHCNSSLLAQLIPTLIVNLAALSGGLSLGFSAIALPQLRSESNVSSFKINEEEGSWIASIFGLGAIFGGFASAYFGSHFGRRKSLLLMAFPDILGWFMIAASGSLPVILSGRFLNGFSAAGYSTSIQIYVAEIAQPRHRGWLSGITIPTLAVGSLLSYVLGTFLSWNYVAVIGGFLPLLLVPGLLWLSDSPYWYLQNNEEKKALQVIERFRSWDNNGMAELLSISDSLNLDAEEFTIKESLSRFTRRQYRRPFLILNGLFLLMTFSGNHAISFYAVDIFSTWHDALEEHLSTIIIGTIKLLGCLIYIPAVKCLSRKVLLCSTSIIMGLALCVIGATNYFSVFHWIPIASVTIYMLADPVGLGSIPYLYTAEFFPSEMRSVLSGLTIGLNNLELFVAVKTFPSLSHALGGIHGAFFFFGGICFLACFYVLIFVPETKGSTLQDIENYFGRKESHNVTPFQTPHNTPGLTKRGLASYPELSLQFTL